MISAVVLVLPWRCYRLMRAIRHAMQNEASSLSWAPVTLRRSTMTVKGHLLVLEAGGQQRAQFNPV